jgi:hypothetical protein
MHRWALVWLALAACSQTLADEALSVCRSLCHCTDTPLPGEQRECVAVCSAQFEMNPLGDACVACVVEHADRCTNLIGDCDPICTQAAALQALTTEDP